MQLTQHTVATPMSTKHGHGRREAGARRVSLSHLFPRDDNRNNLCHVDVTYFIVARIDPVSARFKLVCHQCSRPLGERMADQRNVRGAAGAGGGRDADEKTEEVELHLKSLLDVAQERFAREGGRESVTRLLYVHCARRVLVPTACHHMCQLLLSVHCAQVRGTDPATLVAKGRVSVPQELPERNRRRRHGTDDPAPRLLLEPRRGWS